MKTLISDNDDTDLGVDYEIRGPWVQDSTDGYPRTSSRGRGSVIWGGPWRPGTSWYEIADELLWKNGGRGILI